jgi:hypothetical protein
MRIPLQPLSDWFKLAASKPALIAIAAVVTFEFAISALFYPEFFWGLFDPAQQSPPEYYDEPDPFSWAIAFATTYTVQFALALALAGSDKSRIRPRIGLWLLLVGCSAMIWTVAVLAVDFAVLAYHPDPASFPFGLGESVAVSASSLVFLPLALRQVAALRSPDRPRLSLRPRWLTWVGCMFVLQVTLLTPTFALDDLSPAPFAGLPLLLVVVSTTAYALELVGLALYPIMVHQNLRAQDRPEEIFA